MRLFGRKPRLPAALRPALEADERVLAWAAVDDARAVVATNRGLWLPDRGRLGWHEIHKAVWGGRQLAVTPAEVTERREGYLVAADGPPTTVTLLEPGDVPQAVRARVTRSVAVTSHHPVPGGGVRVVGRRVPGRDGLTWFVRYDEGTDPRGPGVPEATAALVARHAAAVDDPSR